ncbi:TPA: porin, partial [Escherichia coli]|nr:porin [Escherichia coli]
LPEFSNDSYNITDNYATGRTNNVLTYRNSSLFNIDSWRLTVQYLGKNGGNGETNNYRSIKNQNGNGWGIATSYNIHPHFSIGTSYINAERTDEQKTVMPGDKAEAWNIGIKYYNGNAYFASQYAETRNMTPFGNFSNQSKSGDYISAGFANKNKVFEAIAAY